VLIATVGSVTVALMVSACSQGRVDPQEHDPYTVAQRADASAAAEAALSRAAGGAVLATETSDVCSPAEKNWWVEDLSAWTCSRSSRWVVAATSGDPGDVIAGYRAHLTQAGCTLDEASYGMVERYWADYGVAGEYENGDPYTVDDLPSASAMCDTETVGIDFRTPAAVQAAASAPSSSLIIENDALELEALTSAGTPLVVVLGTSRSYHSVSWMGEISGKDEDDAEPDFPTGWCARHSGATATALVGRKNMKRYSGYCVRVHDAVSAPAWLRGSCEIASQRRGYGTKPGHATGCDSADRPSRTRVRRRSVAATSTATPLIPTATAMAVAIKLSSRAVAQVEEMVL
jgi:hypothetical protein